MKIKKVILWGHPLHSHTHSYIHEAFFRAFRMLGYDTYWLDNTFHDTSFDFSGSLFITEGEVDANMPVRKDCWYVLHNVDGNRYQEVKDRSLTLQVYTHTIRDRHTAQSGNTIKKINYYTYVENAPDGRRILYQPWATDLMPNEIDLGTAHVAREQPSMCWWIGTIGGGKFGNIDELTPFKTACESNGISFRQITNISRDQHIKYIRNSIIAPAIVGYWQHTQGYIPCRIFKNISYGQLGITNSPAVLDALDGTIIQNTDTHQLFLDAYPHVSDCRRIETMMKLVKEKHTYVNRIENLLKYLPQ